MVAIEGILFEKHGFEGSRNAKLMGDVDGFIVSLAKDLVEIVQLLLNNDANPSAHWPRKKMRPNLREALEENEEDCRKFHLDTIASIASIDRAPNVITHMLETKIKEMHAKKLASSSAIPVEEPEESSNSKGKTLG